MRITYATGEIAFENAKSYLVQCNKALKELYQFSEYRLATSKIKPLLISYELIDYISDVDGNISQCDDLLTLFNDHQLEVRSHIKKLETQQSALQTKLYTLTDYIANKSNQCKAISSSRKESNELNEAAIIQAKSQLKNATIFQLTTVLFKSLNIEVSNKNIQKRLTSALIGYIKSYQPSLTEQTIAELTANLHSIQNGNISTSFQNEKSSFYGAFINLISSILNEASLIIEIHNAEKELYNV